MNNYKNRSKKMTNTALINAIVADNLLGIDKFTAVVRLCHKYGKSIGAVEKSFDEVLEKGELVVDKNIIYCPSNKVKRGTFCALENKKSGYVDFENGHSVYVYNCGSTLNGDIVDVLIISDNLFDDFEDEHKKQGVIVDIVERKNTTVSGKVVCDKKGNLTFKPDNHLLDRNIIVPEHTLKEHNGEHIDVQLHQSNTVFLPHSEIFATICTNNGHEN